MKNSTYSLRLYTLVFSLFIFSNLSFSQTCVTPAITAYPYNENFESSVGEWTQDTGDDLNWTRRSGGTPSSNTGPSGGDGDTWYMYIEASGWGTGYPSRVTNFESPCLDLTSISNPEFSYSYHMYGADVGTLNVDISTDNGATYPTTLRTYSGNIGNAWNQDTIDLSAYSGQTVKIRFNGTTGASGSGWSSDIAIDNVSLINTTPIPEINIQGNGNDITDGDTTPSTIDDTDFGNVAVASGSNANIFTIQNTGSANLTLDNPSPYITITGHTADFTLTANPSTPIAASGSTTFTITFDPTTSGLRSASISIANNDSNENPYTFDIQGTGTTPSPEINITGNATSIADGDVTPSTIDDTNFGSVAEASGSVANTFTIENLGTLDLTLTNPSPYITITGHTADFTLTANPTTPITASSSTTFTITFDPTVEGTRSATISIANNDSDENPYTFNIQGFGAGACGQTILHTADFESGLDGWTDGGGDAARVNYSSRSYSNNYSLEIRDDTGSASSFDSPLFDLSAYDKVDFKFFFTAYSVENTENFFIEYSSDSGATWTTVSDYICGDVVNKNADYESTTSIIFYGKTSTLLSTNYTFPAATTSQFRVRSDASDNDDLVYIDDITITGTIFCSPTIAPGGITSNLDLWLKADQLDGFAVGSDGTGVNTWVDNGKGNHAETVVTGLEPVYRNNTTRNFNFNPVIDFENNNNTANRDMTYIISDGSRDELKSTAGFNSNDIFIVLMPDPTITTSMIPLDTFCSTDPTGNTQNEDVTGFGYGAYTARFSGELFTYCIGTTSGLGNGYGRTSTNGALDYNQISIINTRHNSGNTGIEIYLNNTQIGTDTSDAADFATINDGRFWIGRSQYWNGSFDGRIAEVITYSATNSDVDLTAARNRIQSYLGIKYGITLGTNGTSQDYVNSDGTVIWDQSVNTGYNYDIAGIGRDDASELNQKQSSSVNDATDGTGLIEGVLTIGLTDIYDTNSDNVSGNANTLNNKEFLMWGNNGVDLNLAAATIAVDMSAGIAGLTTPVTFVGMQRIWKVVENGGDIGTVKVSIPQNAVRNINPPGDYLMFISNTGVFDPTADYRIMTINGTNIEANYDFDGTKYITFGYAPQIEVVRSIYFDGVVDYVDMEDALDLNPTDFTISAWIKRGASSANTSILSKRDAAYTEGYDFKITSTGRFEMSWKNGSTQTITSDVVIPVDEWHQVAVIYSGGSANLYIDGVLDKTASLTAPVNTTRSFNIAAADDGSTSLFEGNIDEVRVWNTALSIDQLRYVMNQEVLNSFNFADGSILPQTITKNEVSSIPWSNLAGYYSMSIYTYTNTNDVSGNSNHGALRNLDTVDRQTAPLPYQSQANGSWNTDATWLNNTVQTLPNTLSIVDGVTPIDWNIVETNHDITIDTYTGLGRERSVLGLMVNSGDLQINGNTAAGTGNGLTVTHYLKVDGTIDLEGESQLIQTTGSDLDVTSSGTLERDQQGTADTYTYNYWSTPVGISNTTTNNNSYTLPDVMKDGVSNINFLTSGYDGTNTSPIGIADYWIWKFANQLDDDYASWQHVRSTGTLLAGEGYTMKGPGTGTISTPQNYVFIGKPNNGDINLTLSAGNDYLVGNPYASAIDAEQFILDNGATISGAGATTGTLYFWEHWGGGSHNLGDYQGGYGTYTLAGGVPSASQGTNDPDVGTGGTPTKTPGRYIPVSQGFFVVAEATGTINFNNGQRVFQKEGATSTFMRSANQNTNNNSESTQDLRMKIRIGFNSVNTIHRQLLLTVNDNTTTGVDWGYDGKSNEDQIDDLYWMIGIEKYNIQSVDIINTESVFPLGIHTNTDGLNNITIDKLENVPENLEILVHDKVLNIYHDLRVSDYEFFLPFGEYLDRFEIVFNNTTLSDTDNEFESLDAHFSNASESIIIINPTLKNIESVELFNMLGQSIYVIKDIPSENYSEFKTKHISSGTYIIKLETETGTLTKKVLIE